MFYVNRLSLEKLHMVFDFDLLVADLTISNLDYAAKGAPLDMYSCYIYNKIKFRYNLLINISISIID